MKPFLLLPLLFIASISIAQKKILSISFLKNDGKYVNSKDSADYFRLVSEPDSGSVLFNVAEYYKDGNKKLLGKTTKIDPVVFDEQCVTFYKSGKRQKMTTYKKGIKAGLEYDFFPNGKPYLELEYPDNDSPKNSFTDNYLIQANFDSLGTVLVENGNGFYKGYDADYKFISEEGNVKNGRKDGVWKGSFDKNKAHFTENYVNGDLIDGNATFEDGTSTVYAKNRGVPPQFKGGLDAFYKYLGQNIDYPDDARANNIQGTVILEFVIEKNGKLTEINVKRSVNRLIDNEAVRVMKKCPLWLPGTQYGRPVRVLYSVPVSFSLSEN